MPDDLLGVYERNSSPAAIAAHYEVPRHTAQGWVRRLRQSHPDAVAESSRDSRPRRG
jgi:transposase-like protein